MSWRPGDRRPLDYVHECRPASGLCIGPRLRMSAVAGRPRAWRVPGRDDREQSPVLHNLCGTKRQGAQRLTTAPVSGAEKEIEKCVNL